MEHMRHSTSFIVSGLEKSLRHCSRRQGVDDDEEGWEEEEIDGFECSVI